MATISFTIKDTQLQRVIDGICEDNSYQATITQPDGTTSPNPETKQQFVKKVIIERIRGMVLSGERKKAEEAIITDQTELDIT